VALAWHTIRTTTRHRATAERVLQDYAGFGAFILANQTYWQLGNEVLAAFRMLPWGGDSVPPGALPAGVACARPPAYFEWPPGSSAPRLVGPPLWPATEAFLRDTLRHGLALLQEVDWRFRFVRMPSEAEVQGFFITAEMGRGMRGFSACLAGADSPVRRVMTTQHALPPALTGALVPDSLYAVRLVDGAGEVLFRSPVEWSGPYLGSSRLGPEFGDLGVELTMRADLAGRLVIGGVPASPTPLAFGLVGVSALLVLATLFLLRREYELIAIRSTFVSSVSHELRTPLSQILLFAELLRLGKLRTEAERQRSLAIIDHEARRLIRLVENVLQFSRRGTPADRPAREPVPLQAAVQDTLEAFRPLADARQARLQAEVPANLTVLGDRGALRQVLLNLLDNAVKYGPEGQVIRIVAGLEAGRVVLAVEDQGPGIPESERAHVWEDFFRLPRDRESAVAGSGIGLAVVRALVEQMGGAVRAETAAGGGTRLVVELLAAPEAG
jgi:signal transduction histidine kinase